MLKYAFVFFVGAMFLLSCQSAPVKTNDSVLPYTYSQLKLYDIDEMTEILQVRVKEFRRTKNSAKLVEALEICLSRPNEDNIIERLMSGLRFAAESEDLWQETVESVAERAVFALKNETTSPADQITFNFILQNLLAEYKVEFDKTDAEPEFEYSIIQKVAEAELIVSKEARQEAGLNQMYSLVSPSIVARDILKELDLRHKSR